MRHRTTPPTACALALVAGLTLTAREAPGQVPDDRLGVRTAPLLLLSRPDVREDLRLSPSQAASADRAIADLYRRALALRGKPDAEAVAGRRAIDESQRSWLEAELSVEQRARLVQVDLQWEGPSAILSRPAVAEAVGLTADQRQSLDPLTGSSSGPGAADPTAGVDDRKAVARKVLASLTPDQVERWNGLLGRPFVPKAVAAGPAPARR